MPKGVYDRHARSGAATAVAMAPVSALTPLEKQAARSAYLYSLVDEVKRAFNLPVPNLSVQMSFPPNRARGRFSSRAIGAVMLAEWKGDEIEKALLVIHPERFISGEMVGQAILLLVGDEIYGSRRHSGGKVLGVEINKETGGLNYTNDEKGEHARKTMRKIIQELGMLPQGHIELPEPAPRQVTRMLKYACTGCGQLLRAAKDPQAIHLTDKGTYVLQQPKQRKPQEQPQPTPDQDEFERQRQRMQERENISNLGKLVEAGAARVVAPAPQPRAFGL